MATVQSPTPRENDTWSPQRLVQMGLVANAVLAVVKLVAGLIGNAYALVADAIESSIDMVGSLVVWGGLRIASRDPDDRYPFGYGRAEAIAGAVVGALMLGAAAGIAIEAIDGIRTPHSSPAWWTLLVLAVVIVIKDGLARRVIKSAEASGSVAVAADGWHHRSDMLTSLAAFVGISAALVGGPGWESADDWAALVAVLVIAVNALAVLRSAAHDLMDGAPSSEVYDGVQGAALETNGVLAIEKLKIRRSGTAFYVDIHVQAEPMLSLHAAHILSGRVKSAIRRRIPQAAGVLIHMEPYEPQTSGGAVTSKARFRTLDHTECEELLASQRVGRLAFTAQNQVNITPVHYVYRDGWIYGRTGLGQKVDIIKHHPWVAFEVDELDAQGGGRSVVVRGRMELPDPEGSLPERGHFEAGVETLRSALPAAFSVGDPMPDRHMVFRVAAHEITGRELRFVIE